MASTLELLGITSGLSGLTVSIFPLGNDTAVNSTADDLTEATNRKGLYTATIAETFTAGLHTVHVFDGVNLIFTELVSVESSDGNTIRASVSSGSSSLTADEIAEAILAKSASSVSSPASDSLANHIIGTSGSGSTSASYTYQESLYGSLEEAQTYFEGRLHSGLWDETSLQDRTKALKTASKMIDRLSFAGEKHTSWIERQNSNCPEYPTETELQAILEAGESQILKFPRGSDTVVPQDIRIACYEIAFELLKGRDPQREIEDLATISQGYSSVRHTRDRSFSHEHLLAGIPSTLAWAYLKKYLRDSKSIRVNRV